MVTADADAMRKKKKKKKNKFRLQASGGAGRWSLHGMSKALAGSPGNGETYEWEQSSVCARTIRSQQMLQTNSSPMSRRNERFTDT